MTQTIGSGSWCSPAQNGNGNTVICNGVPQSAIDRLNDRLNRMEGDLRQKITVAEDWARRYNELNAELEETKKRLAAKGEDPTLVQAAQDLLHDGKLDEARAIFDHLIQSDEGNVDRAAEDYFGRASVFALEFRLDEALPDYAKAYQYRPDDQRFAAAYAYALQKQKDYAKAEALLQELLRQQRRQAAQDPTTYRPDLAPTLTNLGSLYSTTNRFAQAEAAYKEAADIERALAAQNPAAYRPSLAAALTNLGVLYANTDRFPDAEAAYNEAASIRRDLVAQNPAAYRPEFALLLTNMGLLYDSMRRFDDAEAAYNEALVILRELVLQNAASYTPDIAKTLANLGDLYTDMERFGEAEATKTKAIAIQRQLASANPSAYRPDLANWLTDLGRLYSKTGQFKDAKDVDKAGLDRSGIGREHRGKRRARGHSRGVVLTRENYFRKLIIKRVTKPCIPFLNLGNASSLPRHRSGL